MCCHSITTNFSKVSGNYPEIETIKHDEQTKVHGRLRFDKKQHIESQHSEHDDRIAQDPRAITDLIYEQKPLVYQPETEKCTVYTLCKGTTVISESVSVYS